MPALLRFFFFLFFETEFVSLFEQLVPSSLHTPAPLASRKNTYTHLHAAHGSSEQLRIEQCVGTWTAIGVLGILGAEQA